MLKRPETLTNLNPILNDISDKLGLQSNMLRDSRQAEVILSAQGQSIKTHEGLVTHAENRIDQIGLSNRSILLTNEIPFKANPYAASAENTTAAAERDATTTNYPQMLSNILGSQSMSEANILSIKQMLEDSSAKKDEINEIAKIATYGNAEMLSSAVHRTASAIATSNKNFMQDIGSLTRVSPTFIDNRKRQEPLVTVPPIDGTAVENANKAATENKALESERKRFIDTKPANPNPLQSEKKTQEVLAEGKTAVTEPTTEGGVQVPVAPQTTAAVTTPAPPVEVEKTYEEKELGEDITDQIVDVSYDEFAEQLRNIYSAQDELDVFESVLDQEMISPNEDDPPSEQEMDTSDASFESDQLIQSELDRRKEAGRTQFVEDLIELGEVEPASTLQTVPLSFNAIGNKLMTPYTPQLAIEDTPRPPLTVKPDPLQPLSNVPTAELIEFEN